MKRTLSSGTTVLFRAKRKDNNEWIQGYYVKDAMQANSMIAEHAIMQPNCYPVEIVIETLGQYREDIKAFDGDWIKAKTNTHPVDHLEGFLDYQDMECVLEQNSNYFPVCSFHVIDRLSIEVTGKNIYDNPELLEVSQG